MNEKLKISPVTELCEEADEQLKLICQWAEEISKKYRCAFELPLVLLEGRIGKKIDSLHAKW